MNTLRGFTRLALGTVDPEMNWIGEL